MNYQKQIETIKEKKKKVVIINNHFCTDIIKRISFFFINQMNNLKTLVYFFNHGKFIRVK